MATAAVGSDCKELCLLSPGSNESVRVEIRVHGYTVCSLRGNLMASRVSDDDKTLKKYFMTISAQIDATGQSAATDAPKVDETVEVNENNLPKKEDDCPLELDFLDDNTYDVDDTNDNPCSTEQRQTTGIRSNTACVSATSNSGVGETASSSGATVAKIVACNGQSQEKCIPKSKIVLNKPKVNRLASQDPEAKASGSKTDSEQNQDKFPKKRGRPVVYNDEVKRALIELRKLQRGIKPMKSKMEAKQRKNVKLWGMTKQDQVKEVMDGDAERIAAEKALAELDSLMGNK